MKKGCGDYASCENACTFLKHRERPEDYREQRRVNLNNLELDDEVCGKCIKGVRLLAETGKSPRDIR